MNRNESDSEKLERQQRAVAPLRLDQEADEAAQKEVIREAARKAIRDHWPEMPEDERQRIIEAVAGFEAITFQLAIFRRGWATGANAERIRLDPAVAGPRILVRAYATAEADTRRLRTAAAPPPNDRPTLEDRLRRYLPPRD